MSKQFYSNDEQVLRLWDKENIRDLMARHSYYMANNWRRRELNELWVRRWDNQKTASLGNNNGYYVGMDEISNYYVVQNEEHLYERLKPYAGAGIGVEYSSLNLGLGQMAMYTTNTHLVEVAEDGLTAQYCACNNGQITYGRPDGADAYYLGGMIFADLAKEDGEWKIWHLFIAHDHTVNAHVDPEKAKQAGGPGGPGDPNGAPAGQVSPPAGPGPGIQQAEDLGPDPYIQAEFGTPTIQTEAYKPKYGWTFLPEMMPHPYQYFDSRYGYGPEGQKEYVEF